MKPGRFIVASVAFGLLIALLPLALLVPAASPAYAFEGYPDPPTGPIVDVSAAPVVVIGLAGEGESYWSEEDLLIYTLTPFEVELTLLGDVQDEIQIRTWGGTLEDGRGQWSEHQPVFRAGARSRLFLENLEGEPEIYEVVGLDEGKQDEVPIEPTVGDSAPPPYYWSEESVGFDDTPAAGECRSGYCLHGQWWHSQPQPFRVNPNAPGLTANAAESAVVSAFRSWEDDVLSVMDWRYDGRTTLARRAHDGVNAAFWSHENCGNLVACAHRYFDGNRMLGFDIEFNDNYTWIIGSQSNTFDVETVAVHEVGHALGLDHVNDSGQVMEPGDTRTVGTVRRSLGQGDQNGVRRLYHDGNRAYGDFRGGTSVAQGDVDGDGNVEIITGAGPGGGPHVKVWRADGTLLSSFLAYSSGFSGGVEVGAGDVDGDGRDEIVTGPRSGGGPNVKVFRYTGSNIGSFFAYDTGFTGGVNVDAGDVNGDGKAEVITGVGPGGGPHVKVFRYTGGSALGSFFAYSSGFKGGVDVGAGDVEGSSREEIITGPGPGGGPHVKVFTISGSKLSEFFAYDSGFTGGVRVASGPYADIVTGTWKGAPNVRIFLSDGTRLRSFFAHDSRFGGGVEPSSSSVRVTTGTRTDTALFKNFAPSQTPVVDPDPDPEPDPDPVPSPSPTCILDGVCL